MNTMRPEAQLYEGGIPTRASLIARLRNRDDSESWRQFFETYWQLVYGRARKAELNDQEAQEAVQETCIAVARNMDTYDRSRCSFKTWLFSIVSRKITDQFRKRQHNATLMQPLPEDDDPVNAVADPASLQPDEAWEREWEENLMNVAMDRVKEQVNLRHLQVFQYHVLQGHSAAETARHLQTHAAAVYVAKHRVGRLLRKEVEKLRKEMR